MIEYRTTLESINPDDLKVFLPVGRNHLQQNNATQYLRIVVFCISI